MRKRFLKGILLALKINFNLSLIGFGVIFIMIMIGTKGIGAGIFFGIYYFLCYFLIYKMGKNLFRNAKKKAMDKSSQV